MCITLAYFEIFYYSVITCLFSCVNWMNTRSIRSKLDLTNHVACIQTKHSGGKRKAFCVNDRLAPRLFRGISALRKIITSAGA